MHQVGYLFYLLGIVDVVMPWFGVDITGVSWSPLVFFGLGWWLTRDAGGDVEPAPEAAPAVEESEAGE